MAVRKFQRLIRRGLLSEKDLEDIISESKASGSYPEDLLLTKGIPKQELLFCLSEYYGCAFMEYDENITASYFITMRFDMERQKKALWLPLSITKESAEVIAYNPDDPSRIEDIKKTLDVDALHFTVALPSDLIRIIENSYDVNPGFPASGGRTSLAKVRTFLADRRSLMACYRTSYARGRTGLAFIRTGISFVATALLLLRIFGIGYLTIFEAVLFGAGLAMTVDGLIWYIPVRKIGREKLACAITGATWGTTVLEVSNLGNSPLFRRTAEIDGAAELRAKWSDLSPVMRRRFLASDRTDLAEERTGLACYRTVMAYARTGLAFTRTGTAFAGLGIAMLRQFHAGPWTFFDAAIISFGVLMSVEGFYWYLPGRRAGKEGLAAAVRMGEKKTIWDFVFPSSPRRTDNGESPSLLLLRKACSPGIWATTGLALERTMLAERRNVMARLRTIMARSRTGMAFIRTGMSISAVGAALLVYFGAVHIEWAIFDSSLILAGLLLVADGLRWHVPAEKIKGQFPYCFGDMEIAVPDYGTPACNWGKAVFSNERT